MPNTFATQLALLKQRVDRVREDLKSFVTNDRFAPVEKITWTLIFLVITSVVAAGLSLLFKKP